MFKLQKNLCCILVIRLCSDNLSVMATISSSIILEFFPASSWSNSFNPSQSSLGSDYSHFVCDPFWLGVFGFEKVFSLSDPAMIVGDLSFLMIDLSLLLLLRTAVASKYFSLAISNINFLSDKLARSTFCFSLLIFFKRSPFNSNFLSVSRSVNNLSYGVIGFNFFIKRSAPYLSKYPVPVNCVVCLGLVILDKGDRK